ncbi:hypothetical protein RQP46_005869 [Phenoliferia psychrophenolica]
MDFRSMLNPEDGPPSAPPSRMSLSSLLASSSSDNPHAPSPPPQQDERIADSEEPESPLVASPTSHSFPARPSHSFSHLLSDGPSHDAPPYPLHDPSSAFDTNPSFDLPAHSRAPSLVPDSDASVIVPDSDQEADEDLSVGLGQPKQEEWAEEGDSTMRAGSAEMVATPSGGGGGAAMDVDEDVDMMGLGGDSAQDAEDEQEPLKLNPLTKQPKRPSTKSSKPRAPKSRSTLSRQPSPTASTSNSPRSYSPSAALSADIPLPYLFNFAPPPLPVQRPEWLSRPYLEYEPPRGNETLGIVTTSLSNGHNDYSYSTGVTKKFLLNVTAGIVAPDGYERKGILVNGTTPGPKLEVDEGDEVVIKVLNYCGRPITIHWHGIEQRGSPWSDGVAGVTQYAIKSGDTFTYQWKATQSGFYWYHAHTRALISDGLVGAITIKPRPGRPNPFHLIGDAEALAKAEAKSHSLMIGDWGHIYSEDQLKNWNATLVEPLCMQSMPINGKDSPRNLTGNFTAQGCVSPYNTGLQTFPDNKPGDVLSEAWYDCKNTSTALEVISVDRDERWASLHIVNSGANYETVISIDDHKMIVYAADGSYIEPVEVESISIPLGERYSVFIKLDKKVGESFNIVMSGYAVLHYGPAKSFKAPVASKPFIGIGSESLNASYTRFNATYHPPYPAYAPPTNTTADLTLKIHISREAAVVYVLNREPFALWREEEVPPLFSPKASIDANLSLPYESNDVVDVILTAPLGQPPHPIHKHVALRFLQGAELKPQLIFTWSSTAEAILATPESFNLVNPPYRDNFNTPVATASPAWTVVRFVSQDPGPVIMHCHVNLHLASGMAVVLLESMDHLSKIPQQYLDDATEASGLAFNGQGGIGGRHWYSRLYRMGVRLSP